jgi:hypothetical protein
MRINFHGTYSEKDIKLFQDTQNNDLVEICRYLKTDTNLLKNIRFEIFDTREEKQKTDPNHSISRASARFDEMAVYRFWLPTDDPHFPHETTHLVSHTWAKPYLLTEELDTAYGTKIKKTFEMVSTSFMQEGLAIAVDDIVFSRKLLEDGEHKLIDDWCREQSNKLPIPLTQIINLEGFGSVENKIVVPFTASLSKYLLQSFGVDKYKKMYVLMKETNTPEINVETIEKVYGLKEQQIIENWRKLVLG